MRRRWLVTAVMLAAITATSCTGSSSEPAWKDYPRGGGPIVFGAPDKERGSLLTAQDPRIHRRRGRG